MIKTHSQAQGVSYFGSLVTTISAMNIHDWGLLVGLGTGLITFMFGVFRTIRLLRYDKEKRIEERDKAQRDKEEHDMEMRVKQAELDGFIRRRKNRIVVMDEPEPEAA
jgi:type VI protein secretion system component VasK